MSPVPYPRRRLSTLTVALVFGLGASFTKSLQHAAEAQVVGGTITGKVSDPTGAVVPGAKVTVHNTDTGTERALATDNGGRFSAPSLPVGAYAVRIEAEGFAPLTRKDVHLTVGQSLDLPLKLAVAGNEVVSFE